MPEEAAMRNGVLTWARGALAAAALVALLVPTAAAAQDPAPAAAPTAPAPPPAWLVVYGDTVALFRGVVASILPARRVEIANERLSALNGAGMLAPVRVEPIDESSMVLVGDVLAFMFTEEDAVPVELPRGKSAPEVAGERLHHALLARAERLAPRQRWASVAWAIGATLLLVVLIRLLMRLQRFEVAWIDSMRRTHPSKLQLGDVDILSHFTWLVTWLARALTQLAIVVLVVVWAVYVLNRFPETQEFGGLARDSLYGTLWKAQQAVLGAVPGAIAIALIVFAARFVARLSGELFAGIERGTIQLPGVHPETAHATRRLVTTAIWLFAIVVAYPLLPGSGSDAFKGVSVFLGLMVTLGSSGVMGHLMSGLVIVYSRALKPGDFVRVNEIEGMVSEVGALSVKVINSRKEEVTVPNAVIVGTTVKNYSRLCRDTGPALTTGVTIGYDAPWRVVYEMLLTAADRTAGICKQPAPIVYQPELSDFFVVYQLMVRVEIGADRLKVLTELHQNIQDAFNERGVQIMSPHFEAQPEGKVYVPKSKWSVAPDELPSGPRREV